MAAEAGQVCAAGGERAVEVERGSERPDPFHSRSVPAMRTTGRLEALDQPRGDDPDHALVPAFVGEDVAPMRAPGVRPFLDLRDGLAQDPVLDRLALAVQLLQPARKLRGDLLVVR